MQLAANAGAKIRSTVSKNTDILVVGVQNERFVGETGKSSKERKAEELIQEGIDIDLISEDDFIKLVHGTKRIVE